MSVLWGMRLWLKGIHRIGSSQYLTWLLAVVLSEPRGYAWEYQRPEVIMVGEAWGETGISIGTNMGWLLEPKAREAIGTKRNLNR